MTSLEIEILTKIYSREGLECMNMVYIESNFLLINKIKCLVIHIKISINVTYIYVVMCGWWNQKIFKMLRIGCSLSGSTALLPISEFLLNLML